MWKKAKQEAFIIITMSKFEKMERRDGIYEHCRNLVTPSAHKRVPNIHAALAVRRHAGMANLITGFSKFAREI